MLRKSFLIVNESTSFASFASRDKIFLKGRDNSELAVVYSSYISKLLSRYRGSNNIGALIMEPVSSRLSCMDILTLHMLWLPRGKREIGEGDLMDVDHEDIMLIMPPLFALKHMPENLV
ncbi:hypothetical protein HN51_027252 [Arachis hypogaea]